MVFSIYSLLVTLWLAITVDLIKFRITWEESLNVRLSALSGAVGIFFGPPRSSQMKTLRFIINYECSTLKLLSL